MPVNGRLPRAYNHAARFAPTRADRVGSYCDTNSGTIERPFRKRLSTTSLANHTKGLRSLSSDSLRGRGVGKAIRVPTPRSRVAVNGERNSRTQRWQTTTRLAGNLCNVSIRRGVERSRLSFAFPSVMAHKCRHSGEGRSR